uniref:FYVE-type domain-containing protein n=1 Tax=Phytophthora ramorum TaxID=164328 RepID=H3GUU6_PHYRM
MAGGSRFTVNPFPDLVLNESDRTQLVEIASELVMTKFAEYQAHINNQKYVDEARWKKYSKEGNTTQYLERKKANPDSKLPALLMVGPLPGSLDENMFGCVSPTLEAMRIKSSYLKDFNAAAVLATIMEPTVEEPFRSVVVKWMEIDIPGASLGILRNRDYIYLESTGILRLDNGERVGYHLLHSVSFPQTHELPSRVRGNMSFCAMFHQEGPDKTDCRGTGIMNPGGDMIRVLGVMGMAQATMAGLKYSYCGQMKKLSWLLEQKHAEARENGTPAFKPVCVTCSKEVKSRTFGGLGKPSSKCKLCFGSVCSSCKIPKKLSFIAPDLELVQRKVAFCAKCLLEATHMDTEEAARVQFVYKHTVTSSVYGSSGRYSEESTRSDSTMDAFT